MITCVTWIPSNAAKEWPDKAHEIPIKHLPVKVDHFMSVEPDIMKQFLEEDGTDNDSDTKDQSNDSNSTNENEDSDITESANNNNNDNNTKVESQSQSNNLRKRKFSDLQKVDSDNHK
eukprot:UN11333